MIQSIHNALENVECRESSHAATIERQQTEASGVEKIWLFAMLSGGRLLHGSIGFKVVLAFQTKPGTVGTPLRMLVALKRQPHCQGRPAEAGVSRRNKAENGGLLALLSRAPAKERYVVWFLHFGDRKGELMRAKEVMLILHATIIFRSMMVSSPTAYRYG